MITGMWRVAGVSLIFTKVSWPPNAVFGAPKKTRSNAVDFTIFWRRLSHWVRTQDAADHTVRDLFLDRVGFDAWLLSYLELLAQYPRAITAEMMLKTNPRYVLRNHLGAEAIQAAKRKDFTVVAALLKVLERPYDEHPEYAAWADFPPDWASSIEISCSS